ncbi:hypothetical protein [Paludisphaera rhizosphaerae]|uniref:hypothetical protein n=1 Tax=Paludisphaera rhizosphaerae TaxID=2711216 RepID=UPI0013ED1A2D|nr:hypothetical protein [Paludisphaera rhizosphaerae]
MLAPLLCLLGLTLISQDGSSVSVGAVVRAPEVRSIERTEVATGSTTSTPLDDEVEDYPEEPEGEDDEDPGDAVDHTKGRSATAALIAAPVLLGFIAASPPLSFRETSAHPRGVPLSLLCRLLF